MKLTDDQIQKQAEAILAKLTAHKDFKPVAVKGEDKFIANIDTANEEVERLAGGIDIAFIANVNVANAVIALLRERSPRNTDTAQTSKPTNANARSSNTPARTLVATPKPKVEAKPTAPVKQPFPPLRKGATGHERAAWANAKAQHDKENK